MEWCLSPIPTQSFFPCPHHVLSLSVCLGNERTRVKWKTLLWENQIALRAVCRNCWGTKIFLVPFLCSFSSVQLLSHVQLFATPWTAACQFSLSITNSQSKFKLTSIESVMPSKHLILCRQLFLLPSIFPSIRVFSNESALCIRCQSIGVSTSASVLPVTTQDWSPLGWTGWSPCSPRDSQESYPTPQFKSINSLALSFLYSPTLTSIHDYWKKHSFLGSLDGLVVKLTEERKITRNLITRIHSVAQMVKCLPTMQYTWIWYLGWEDPLEKERTTHSSILAWKIPWTEDPGRLQSMGSQRVGHNWAISLSLYTLCIHGRDPGHWVVKVAQSCPTLYDPMDYTVHGILQAKILKWVVVPSPGDLPNPGIKPRSPTLQEGSLPAEPPGKPKNSGVG